MIRFSFTLALLLLLSGPLMAGERSVLDQFIEKSNSKDPKVFKDYVCRLSLEELQSLGREACLRTEEKTASWSELSASFLVNTSYLVMKERFPKQVLDVALSKAKDVKENALLRKETMRWLGAIYSKRGSSPEDVNRIIKECNDILVTEKENKSVRIRAMRCAAKILGSKTREAYSGQEAYRSSLKKDKHSKMAAMKAAAKKGFVNPWQKQILLMVNRMEAILNSPKEDKEVRLYAVYSLGPILKILIPEERRDQIVATLRKALAKEQYDYSVKTAILMILVTNTGDSSLRSQIEEAMGKATNAKDDLNRDRCLFLLRRIETMNSKAATTQPSS